MRIISFRLLIAAAVAVTGNFATAANPGTGGIYTVQGSRVGATVSLGGTVVPQKEVTLSAQVPGRVEAIAGEEGDEFESGVKLVVINDDDLLAQRRAAVAQLANADAQLRNAGVQYSREWVSPYGGQSNEAMGGMPSMFNMFTQPMRGVMPGGGSPGYDRYSDLYTQGTRVDQARSSVIAARSKIEEVDARLRDTKSLAPFNGVITRKLVEVGDTVQPGQPLLKFADTQVLQIKVEVPARLMPGVRHGMVVPARLDVGRTQISVRVARIFPVADPDRHTVTVKFDIPPGAPGAPGMYAEVMIPDTSTNVRELPVIPASTLVWRGSLPGVYVLNESNKSELRLVRLGDELGEGMVAVLSGLKIGERVMAGPPEGARSGWTSGQ